MSHLYDIYIVEHRNNVASAHSWLKWNLPDFACGTLADDIIEEHDYSKNHSEEYEAYDRYFYGNNRSNKVVSEFKRAWLRHIHNNPHHWQHWVLINDEPNEGTIALEMDREYVIEMICDWWSFSWKTGNLYEIFEWYDKHKDNMILHKNTRELVEDILGKIREKLDSENNK